MSFGKLCHEIMQKLRPGHIFGLLFGLGLAILCFLLGSDILDISTNLLLLLIGLLLGWHAGTFFSPIDEKDEKRLRYAGATVGGFVSGYLLSKVDPILQAQVALLTKDMSIVDWPKVGIFVAGFLLAAVWVFECRSYGIKKELPEGSNNPGGGA